MVESVPTAPSFGVFERDVLPERIAARLVSLIAERQLRPGDRLPPERDLAAAMQVSRPSLREALRALATLNIVEIRQGSGTYVASPKPEVMIERFDLVFALDDPTFAELLEARQLLEPGLAALAAQRATEDDLAFLRGCVDRAAATLDDPEGFLKADLELHQAITALAQNHIVARFMDSLTRLSVASRRRTGTVARVRSQTLDDHRAIVEALSCRDAAAAAEIMRRHIENVRSSLLEAAAEHATQAIAPGEADVTDHHVG